LLVVLLALSLALNLCFLAGVVWVRIRLTDEGGL
jgi:hypothetical protein